MELDVNGCGKELILDRHIILLEQVPSRGLKMHVRHE